MNKELIKNYIQFAIDNGLNFNTSDIVIKFDYKGDMSRNNSIILYVKDDYFIFNIIEIITSKEFIEAIARGLYNGNKGGKENFIRIGGQSCKTYYENDEDIRICINEIIEAITIKQAITIRDGKLEEFIKTIII